jgi:hypothetical protein
MASLRCSGGLLPPSLKKLRRTGQLVRPMRWKMPARHGNAAEASTRSPTQKLAMCATASGLW